MKKSNIRRRISQLKNAQSDVNKAGIAMEDYGEISDDHIEGLLKAVYLCTMVIREVLEDEL